MARLVFGMNQSLDGYVDHMAFAPSPTVFRRRDTDADWEVTLEAPVNRVLPVARAHLERLWAAFGEA